MYNLSDASQGIAQCANSILRAWQIQDMQSLSSGLARALEAGMLPAGSAHECEMRELLLEVASEIRRAQPGPDAGRGADPERIGVCLGLLEHLAATH